MMRIVAGDPLKHNHEGKITTIYPNFELVHFRGIIPCAVLFQEERK